MPSRRRLAVRFSEVNSEDAKSRSREHFPGACNAVSLCVQNRDASHNTQPAASVLLACGEGVASGMLQWIYNGLTMDSQWIFDGTQGFVTRFLQFPRSAAPSPPGIDLAFACS